MQVHSLKEIAHFPEINTLPCVAFLNIGDYLAAFPKSVNTVVLEY